LAIEPKNPTIIPSPINPAKAENLAGCFDFKIAMDVYKE
jgi:hypothetical protein